MSFMSCLEQGVCVSKAYVRHGTVQPPPKQLRDVVHKLNPVGQRQQNHFNQYHADPALSYLLYYMQKHD